MSNEFNDNKKITFTTLPFKRQLFDFNAVFKLLLVNRCNLHQYNQDTLMEKINLNLKNI